MSREAALARVAALHAAMLATLVLVRHLLGSPVGGALLGGGLAGLSFATFWVFARSITEPRKKGLAILLGAVKITLYVGLSAAILGGWLVTDGIGFALGVSCFVAAAVVGALAGPLRGRALAVAGD